MIVAFLVHSDWNPKGARGLLHKDDFSSGELSARCLLAATELLPLSETSESDN